jgi:hypothetical protein
MNVRFIRTTLLFALIVVVNTIGFSQEKIKEEQKVAPISDLKSNDAALQKSTTVDEQKTSSPFDKYDANRADFNNTNNYGAKSSSSSSGADDTDIGTPTNSPFNLGSDISGFIQNSINQVTGKLAFSVPLASVSSGTTSYALNLGYDGQSAFKIGKELNKYSPTSVVGVGWSLSIPKIVVNNKQTTTRDDDEFYIIDGATNSKLICIDKLPTLYTFQLEKYANWKITYSTIFDSWTVIKDDGNTYSFGQSGSSNSRERMSVWGNWIGDSNQTPNGHTTVVWNISQIRDQWNNFINFKYELIEGKQNNSQVSYKHTEASYLKEIISSKGAKIKLNYGFKDFSEYYEPHREKSEPDAYQERYEKKYLQDVEVYNNNNQIVTSYALSSTLYTISGGNKKRYLTSITQASHSSGGQSHSLPSQTFEYHTSGTYRGGLKEITYPSGGSVTYNYQNKYLFYNGSNKYVTTPSWPSGYNFYSAVVRDNYSIFVLRTANPVSGGKHRFKFFRYWWNGQQWESHEFTFPHLIEDDYPNNGDRLKNFHSILEDDFYGFAFDKGSTADIYLFHKEKNGSDWDYYPHTNLSIGSDAPTFMSGDGFVALGTNELGRLYNYTWNGASWNFKQINQGNGKYHYASTNNFVLSFNRYGWSPFTEDRVDMITGGNHPDYYYIHYLDNEKKWQTKSWSAFADSNISAISDPSNLFPSSSIAGFVADNNPELFLRWDKNYNLIAVDNVLGAYNDAHSLQPVNNSMFTLVWWWFNEPTKTARFNGINWSVSGFSSSIDRYHVNFGLDLMTYKNESSDQIMFKEYSPNYHSWIENNLNWATYAPYATNGINTEFFVAGKEIYKKTFLGPPSFPTVDIGTLQYNNYFTYSDGLSHTYVKQHDNSGVFKKGSYYYINKENGLLSEINLGLKYYLRGSKKFGGNTPFMSPKAIWVRYDNSSTNFNPYLYRIIEDKFNQSVYDIVIGSIDLDDDNGNTRKINYTYNIPNSLPDNNATYYGEVTVENKGFGSSSTGKIKKVFNTGGDDVQMLGLQLEEHVLDTDNNLKRKTTNTWQKYQKTANNGSYQVDLSHYIALKSKKEEVFFDTYSLENLTDYSYNSKGQLYSTSTTNSKGQVERQDIKYAHQQYSFVRDKNMLRDVYETTTKLNNAIVDIKRNIWHSSSGKAYIKEEWSGPSASELRLNAEFTNVDTQGNLLETSDGKDIYNSVLYGYSNLYEVASIVNAKHQDVVNELDITYTQLQNLSTSSLKIELMKLYDRLPNAMISLTFYDDNGRVINRVNERKEESFIYYDPYGRVDYITDSYGNILEKKEHNFGN